MAWRRANRQRRRFIASPRDRNSIATEFAFGTGREPNMPGLKKMMSAEQVAEAIVFTLRQDPELRTLRLVVRPMSEPVWGSPG